jgi:hypothetical protein
MVPSPTGVFASLAIEHRSPEVQIFHAGIWPRRKGLILLGRRGVRCYTASPTASAWDWDRVRSALAQNGFVVSDRTAWMMFGI